MQFYSHFFNYLFLIFIYQILLRYLYPDIFRLKHFSIKQKIQSISRISLFENLLVMIKFDKLSWIEHNRYSRHNIIDYISSDSSKHTIDNVLLSFFLKLLQIFVKSILLDFNKQTLL